MAGLKIGRREIRRRWGYTGVGVTLVAVLLLVVGSAIATHYQASLEGSNFEIDTNANLVVDQTGMDDWASVSEARRNDAPTGRNDDSYAGGAKEDDTCPGLTTGSIPNNKSDLLSFGVDEESGNPGFMHLYWTRVQEPSGTTLMDFELNQSSTDCGNGVNPVRTVGDLLIEYRINQGGARAQVLECVSGRAPPGARRRTSPPSILRGRAARSTRRRSRRRTPTGWGRSAPAPSARPRST